MCERTAPEAAGLRADQLDIEAHITARLSVPVEHLWEMAIDEGFVAKTHDGWIAVA